MEKVVLKVSGEALKEGDNCLSERKLEIVYNSIKTLLDNDKGVVIIPGGGNIWRGRSHDEMDANAKDSVGMLATVMNGLTIKEYLTRKGLTVYLSGSFLIEGMIEKYNPLECLSHLEKKEVIIIVGGVGLPYTTTDFACVQRALELGASYLLMGKNIDGIYDSDPHKNVEAKKYDHLTHDELLAIQVRNGFDSLGVMDINALALLCTHKLKTILYQVDDQEAIPKILKKVPVGTLIESK